MTPPRRKAAAPATPRWTSARTPPPKAGWYQVLAPDNWRLWKGGCWWKPVEGAPFVAHISERARFRWRGPARPAKLTYAQVVALAGGTVQRCGGGGGKGCA